MGLFVDIGLSTYQFIPYYAGAHTHARAHTHTHTHTHTHNPHNHPTHILMPFEDRELTG